MKSVVSLIVWLALSFAAAAVGAAASVDAREFYSQLEQPTWSPPGWLFGPVWTILYAMMGVAAWLVWESRGRTNVKTALLLFIIQLVMNALWSWLFFQWRLGFWSSVEIVALWILIISTIAAFWQVKPLAAGLLVPYLAWVSFATALNITLWRMNPTLLG
jgi:benzodiazapine receptor